MMFFHFLQFVKCASNKASVENEKTSSFCIIFKFSFIKQSNRSPSFNIKFYLQKKRIRWMLYKEGFHICNGELFGKHRKGDDCLFCLEVLSE